MHLQDETDYNAMVYQNINIDGLQVQQSYNKEEEQIFTQDAKTK